MITCNFYFFNIHSAKSFNTSGIRIINFQLSDNIIQQIMYC